VCFVLFTLATIYEVKDSTRRQRRFCVSLFVFCFLVNLVRLSVAVQVIYWKDSSLKWPVGPPVCWWGR